MEIINSNPDCGVMTFFIHNTCNFKCSYCSEEHYGGSHRWPEGQTWDNYLDLIDDMKEKNKYLYIELLGGEPTLWPKFHEFVEYISDENTFIEYETNRHFGNTYEGNLRKKKRGIEDIDLRYDS